MVCCGELREENLQLFTGGDDPGRKGRDREIGR